MSYIPNTDRNFGYPKPLDVLLRDSLLSDDESNHIWAAYFNMARYNMYKTLVHISSIIGLDDGENLEHMMNRMRVLNEPLSPEEEIKARKLLYRHFPFLQWAFNPKAKEGEVLGEDEMTVPLSYLRKCLKDFSYTLNIYRNHYSHSRRVETRDEETIRLSRLSERKTGRYLNKFLTVSVRRVKTRYDDKTNLVQRGMVDTDSMKFITGDRMKGSKYNRKYFLNPLYDPGVDETLSDGTNPEKLTRVGKIQLVCLFLEKKYITEFLTQIRFLDPFHNDAQAPRLSDRRLILEVMSDLRIRMPQSRIDSTRDDVQVALDMLNELKKCPAELFDLLGPEDKASFSVESSTCDTVLMRRSRDRFTQLALQWFDMNGALRKVRFQVNAGVLRYLFNDSKTCVDGRTRLRVLQEPLNGFGRLNEVEQLRDASRDGEEGPWKGFLIKGYDEAVRNDASILPYINDVRTRYIVNGENIGMRFGGDGEPDGDFLPGIVESDGRYRVPSKMAQCTMSTYELPAMLFLHLLRPGGENAAVTPVEEVIISKVSAYRKLFADVRDGQLAPEGLDAASLDKRLSEVYGVRLADIPDRIGDYLLGKVSDDGGFKAYRRRMVDSLKEQTEYRLRRLDDDIKAMRGDMNKPGKRGFVQIRPGSMASFIARDIVLFQEAVAERKLTGLNYSVMQGSIATLGSPVGTSAADLVALFSSAGLVGEDGSRGTHPFLFRILSTGADNTIVFYKNYLEARKSYLGGVIPDDAPFLHADRARWAVHDESFYKAYAARCLDRPVMLPRQLFEEQIRKTLLSLEGEGAEALRDAIAKAGDRCNTTFMIGRYFELYFNDYPQPFYGTHVEEYDGELDHRYGHRFFNLVRKNIGESKGVLKSLESDKSGNHSVYMRELRKAIAWAKKNPLPAAGSKKSTDVASFPSRLKKAFNEYTSTEKMLRRYVVQDELMFLAALRTIRGMVGLPENGEGDWMLCDIGPHADSILDGRLPSVRTTARLNTRRNLKKDKDGPLKKVQLTVEQHNVRLKDYGEVFKLLSDERLASLLRYHKNEVVQAEDLKAELERYDQSRVGVFKDIMEYEAMVTAGVSDRELCEAMPSVNSTTIDFKVMQHFDKENDELTQKELSSIRNAFSHNSYPEKEVQAYVSKERKTIHDASVPGTAAKISERAREISLRTRKRK